MNEFKTYHPIVNFTYFALVIGFSMFFMHPVCLGISFLSSLIYAVVLKGKKALKTNIVYILPLMIAMAIINPLFNHEGATILCYFSDSNPLTLESVIYGFAAAVMVASVIGWFSCFNEIMTGDKFIYLFGRIIPSLSLVLSMTLRFVPKFTAHLKEVRNAQKCIGRDISNGNIIRRARNGLTILSIMITWALENSVDTADSMKSRGYGLEGRSSFSIFRFDRRDAKAFICIMALGIYVFTGYIFDVTDIYYFPVMGNLYTGIYGLSVYTAYLMLCLLPVIIEAKEAARWNAIKSKI